jgi:putative transposase
VPPTTSAGPASRPGGPAADVVLSARITDIHDESKGTYGSPRVHQVLLRQDVSCGKRRVARLMRAAGLEGRRKKRWRTTTIADPAAERARDLIGRWLTDITEHPTTEGKIYCAAVMDAYSRRVIGWSIDKRQDTNLVVSALVMAVTRRGPSGNSTILHSDHGTQYTAWAFGKRLRDAGLLGSMGTIGDCYDNAMMESFWHTMQLELLDTRTWKTREELANAIFEWIECWYNPYRRHSSIGMHSPITFEQHHTPPDPST